MGNPFLRRNRLAHHFAGQGEFPIDEPWSTQWSDPNTRNPLNQKSLPPSAALDPDAQAIIDAIVSTRTLKQTNTVPITSNTDSTIALLTKNINRKLLVIQNGSTATTAGDVAPTFYIGFGQIATVGLSVGLPPGVGLVLDVSCPSDAIFITVGPETNTGGSVVVQGCAVEGA